MLFILVTGLSSKASFWSKGSCFGSLPCPLDKGTAWKWFLLPHPQQVWSYAEQTVFPLWWEYFDTFRLISGCPTSNQLNEFHHHDRHLVLEFLSLFSLRWPGLPPFEDILWRDCLYCFVAAWVFKSFMAFSAFKKPWERLKAVGASTGDFIRSFRELLLKPIWINRYISISLALVASPHLTYLQ